MWTTSEPVRRAGPTRRGVGSRRAVEGTRTVGAVVRNPSLQLAALATVAIPGLDVVATRPPQRTTSDYRYCGILDAAGRHWVVQAPLHPASTLALEAEVQMLRELRPAIRSDELPFDVAIPEGFAALPGGGRAMVYRELPGRELDIDALRPGPGPTVTLARAIGALHELPGAVVADAGLPVYDAESYRLRRLAEVDDAARTGKVPPVLLARWEQALEDVTLWRFRATPVHGDLAAENVLVSNGQVVALTNWSNAHVGDPAEDLAWLYAAAPEDSLDTLEEAYALARSDQPDPHLVDRALLYSELAVARWLLHGVRIDDPTIVADAEDMLASLARQVADSDPIGRTQPVVTPAWEGEAATVDADDATSPQGEPAAAGRWAAHGSLDPDQPGFVVVEPDDAATPPTPATGDLGTENPTPDPSA